MAAASFRVGIRSRGCFSRFGGFLAMTLIDLTQMFSTDEQCRILLKGLRWPYGVECVRCKGKRIFEVATQKKFECVECGHQFSVLTQTISTIHTCRLRRGLWPWLLLCEARKGMSAIQIKRTLGNSYKTAWYLCHRIRAAMKEADAPMLDGTVEIDETYVGGKKHGACIRGRGSEKEIVVGIRQRNGDLRFFHAKDAKSGTLAKYIRENVSEDVDVMVTDEWMAYPDAMRRTGMGEKHKRSGTRKSMLMDDIHTNTVESAFSLLKRGIMGTWHKISAKHLRPI